MIEKYQGFISRKLSVNEDGLWMDVVYWTDLKSAENASKHILENKLAQKYFEMIDDNTVECNHFNVIIDTEK